METTRDGHSNRAFIHRRHPVFNLCRHACFHRLDVVIAIECLADKGKLDHCQQVAGFGGIGQHFRLYFRCGAALCLNGTADFISGIGKDTFDVANRLFRGIRGGLGISTVAANAIFAAVTGISIASAAVFTKVAVPEMIRLGHKPRFAVGVVTGSSVLGMLIPPSLLLILFGVLTETSIGDLFKAGILPGILLSAAYSGLILLMAWRFPDYVGQITDASGKTPAMQMGLGQAIWKLTPIALLVALVLGGIYAGWFTPTESGAVGALGALILALGKRQLSWGQAVAGSD